MAFDAAVLPGTRNSFARENALVSLSQILMILDQSNCADRVQENTWIAAFASASLPAKHWFGGTESSNFVMRPDHHNKAFGQGSK